MDHIVLGMLLAIDHEIAFHDSFTFDNARKRGNIIVCVRDSIRRTPIEREEKESRSHFMSRVHTLPVRGRE